MNITLHLPTAAITVAIGSLALFGMSASAPQGTTQDRDIQAIEDVDQPAPEDLVWLNYDGGTVATFTVPTGRSLVLTGIVGFGGHSAQISIDGGPFRTFFPSGSTSLFSGIGLTEGQVISLEGSYEFNVFGYLVDA